MAKNNNDEDTDVFINRMFEQKMKERARNVKIFSHPIHNFSTGLLPLDYMINPGNPGILAQNIALFAGEQHSGKSTVLMNMARDTLNKGHKVNYIDVEGGLTDSFCKLFGITKQGTPGFKYWPPGMDIVDYYEIVIGLLDGLQGKPDPMVIGVDSIRKLYPESDLRDPLRMGGNVQVFNNFLKHITRRLSNTNALIMFIGATGSSFSMYEDPPIQGGQQLKLDCSLTCLTYKRVNPGKPGKDEHHTIVNDSGKEVTYRQKLGLKIVKNKWAPLDKTSKMDYYLNTKDKYCPAGLDNAHAMLQVLKDAGELQYAASAGYKMDGISMSWLDWEHACYSNTNDILTKVVNKTMAVLDKQYNQ